jgi:hypothetical protein
MKKKEDYNDKFVFLRSVVDDAIRRELDCEDDLYCLAQKMDAFSRVLFLASLELDNLN